jgi:cytoskeletal protein CcmA (bactofilin family)
MKRSLVFWLVVFSIFALAVTSAYAETVVIDVIVEGDRIIEVDTQLLSIIQGNVTVNPGVTFQLDGIVTGNVTVEGGATLVLNGIVNGDVTLKEGAAITLEGIVGGKLYNQSGTVIDPGVINGIVKGEIVNL